MEAKKINHVTFDVTDSGNALSFTEKSRLIARQITEHIIVKAIIIVLILADICVVIALLELEIPSLNYISFGFSCIFVVEVLLRIYGLG